MRIPITKTSFGDREARAVAAVLRSGWVLQGPRVEAFERAVAAYVGAKEAVATNSCTTALHLALLLLDVGPGDEVAVPSFSFIATANAVLYCGAVPRFVDIDPTTFNMDPDALAAVLNRKMKAVMPVDQIGLPADLERIGALAARYRIPVAEDAACAIGATVRGRRVGSISRLSCFSFHPRKVMTTGEGGMITTDDSSLAARARILRSHGMSRSTYAREGRGVSATETYEELGFNYRMTDLQGAIGLEQLKRLDEFIAARQRLARRYHEALGGWRGVAVPSAPKGATHTYQSYLLRVAPEARMPRDAVLAALQEQGIGAKGSLTAIHLEPLYRRRFGRIELPETERAAREGVLLPLYPEMTRSEQDHVIRALEGLLGPAARSVRSRRRAAVR